MLRCKKKLQTISAKKQGKKVDLKEFTSALIYNACQIGLNISLNDLAFHTFVDLNNYVAKLVSTDDKNTDVPTTSIDDLRKSSGKNYG